jgi:hypothetical protein
MIERELDNDRKNQTGRRKKINEKGTGLTAVDYGSNYGYFSIQFASKYPEATIISLEGEAYHGLQFGFISLQLIDEFLFRI